MREFWETDMAAKLLKGTTCADCLHIVRCTALGCTWPEREECDWDPSRFYFSLRYIRRVRKEAFEAGYNQGHNDTVESCVRDSAEAAWDDYMLDHPERT
jgi:hypothetical protein